MTGLSPYQLMLRSPQWQRTRLRIMDRDGWRCRECRTTDNNLQVHHRRYAPRGGAPWEVEDRFLVTLCEDCHERITKLIARAREILSELNLYELPIAVEQLENMLTPESPTYDQDPARELRNIEAEKAALISSPYSCEASRRVDELEARREDIIAKLDAGVPRAYGGES